MRKYFTTGLILLLPLILTILIVGFFVNFVTQPLLGSVEAWLIRLGQSHPNVFALTNPTLIVVASKVFILFFFVILILIVGVLGKNFFAKTLFYFGDYLFHRLPIFNKFYKASQDVIHHIFSDSSNSFSQVVFVPFPHAETLSVGLVVRHSIQVRENECTTELISVFIPGTPNPSVGFLLMFRLEQLIFVNMKVDEAMKFIVSCGVVMPEFAITKTSFAENGLK